MSARVLAYLALAALIFAPGSVASQPNADGSFQSARQFMERDGEAVFRDVCAACHMPDARGAVGAGRYPALASNPKLSVAGYPVFMVVNGQGAMPSFAALLDDVQIAGVVNYVRTHFGNDYRDTVSPADVKLVRPPP
jgi:mono/diheme cytochrome c family protein